MPPFGIPTEDIPDTVLTTLLRQLPRNFQLAAHRVCTKSAAQLPTATAHTSSLILLLGADQKIAAHQVRLDGASYYRQRCQSLITEEDGSLVYPKVKLNMWNSLKLNTLNEADVKDIVAIYPAVKNLLVIISKNSSAEIFTNLSLLLTTWSAQLKSFKLIEEAGHLVDNDDDGDEIASQFFASINGLQVLQKLSLKLENLPLGDLPIIGKLEEFEFSSATVLAEEFVQMLQKHVGEESDVKILYRAEDIEELIPMMTEAESFPAFLRNKIVALDTTGQPVSNPEDITPFFPALTTLYLAPHRISFAEIYSSLAQLPHLATLHLDINFQTIYSDLDVPVVIFTQLPTIKALKLDLRASNHDFLTKMTLPITMPNLQVLELNFCYYKCDECAVGAFYPPGPGASGNHNLARNCLQQIFRPMTAGVFERLRILIHNLAELGPMEMRF